MALGKFLADKRVSLGITQADLGRRLGYSSAQFVSNWERGTCSPPLQAIPKLCEILKIPMKDMVELMTKAYRDHLQENLSVKRKKTKRA